jgi:PAS domain S-box-containing protein
VDDHLTALLIEDNPGDARLIREMLREAAGGRSRLEVCDRLAAGLERLGRGDVDVVLLDLSLPDAHGFDTFARAYAQAPDVPIVVLTGADDDALAVRAVQEGAQDYLPKGAVNAHGLWRSMRYAVERKRSEIERTQLLARAQAAHAEAEAERGRIQAILESAAHGIVFVDAQTGTLTTNPAAARLFGRPLLPEAGVGQYVGQVCQPDGRPLAADELLTARALRGEAVADEEEMILRPDGSQVPVLASASPVRDGTQQVIGAAVVFQDISPLKELERLREEWTSVIAHDLRQPVAAIAAFAGALEALAQRDEATAEATAGVSHILAAASQIDRMIGDLLDASRLGAGQLKLDPMAVDLPLLIQTVVQRMRETLGDHRVETEIAGPIPRLWADPGRLEQVLVNLLSNAAKYSPPGSPLGLAVARRDSEVEVAISNRGAGIPPEELPRLFARFYRTRGARIGVVKGLGLGLYISRELVQAHGGRIWVESAPGDTTTFHFTLPVREAQPAA